MFIINRFTRSVTKVSDVANNRKSKVNFGLRAYELHVGDTITIPQTKNKLYYVKGFTLNEVIVCRVGYRIQAYIRKESIVRRVSWYNKKSGQTYKKLKESIQFLYETKKSDEILFFVTITTNQHKNGFTDNMCNHKFGLWAKNRKEFHYVAICERQRITTDIHYHCIIRCKAWFDIPKETAKLAKLFNVAYHPALFDVKRVSSVPALQNYLRKYFSKNGVKECRCKSSCKCKPAYSSLFQCRTLLISKGVNKSLKTYANKYVLKVPDIVIESYKHLLVERFSYEYYTVYDYKVEIWNAAMNWRLSNLKAANLARMAD